jgi:hypothetical protein
MAEAQWSLKGEYFESCNCEILCPCIVQGTGVRPTEGHCDVALAFHIQEGDFNGTDLGELNFVAANYTPGPMADGNWTSALYVDERANPQQRDALEQILSGSMGGPAERWRALTTHFMGMKYVPIDFRVDGKVHSVTIPNVMDFSVEPVIARGQRDAMLLANTGHGVNRDLYLAKGTRGSYTDHGMCWDNTGKNGHYAPFSWQWPAS